MLDRGLRAPLPARRRARGAGGERAVERGAARAATCATCRRSRSTRPTAQGLRRRDLRRGARRRRAGASGSTSPTSARYVQPGLADRPRGLPARDERLRPRARSSRCCPRRCPTAPARSCPAQERLAVTVELELRRRARSPRRAFYRSLIRSDERLDYDRVDRIFAGDERAEAPWAEPLAAARAAAARARRRAREEQRRARRRVRRARLPLRRPRPRQAADATRPDRVAPADRAPDDRRQRGGRAAARRAQACRRCTASTSAPSPARVERLVAQLASLGVPTPPLPEPLSPSQAAELVGEISRAVDRHVRRHGPRPPRPDRRSCCARSSRPATSRATSATPGCTRRLLPLHLADPPLPRPGLPPRAARRRSAAARTRRARSAMPEAAASGRPTRERDAMVIERDADDIARCFLLERELFESGCETEFDGEIVGADRRRRVRRVRRRLRGHAAGAQARRGDWWELDEHGASCTATRSGSAIRARRSGDRVHGRARRGAARPRRSPSQHRYAAWYISPRREPTLLPPLSRRGRLRLRAGRGRAADAFGGRAGRRRGARSSSARGGREGPGRRAQRSPRRSRSPAAQAREYWIQARVAALGPGRRPAATSG